MAMRIRANRFRVGLCVALAAACGVASGQLPDLAVPPPPIAFADWRRVELGETYREYSVHFPSAMVTAYEANNVVPLRVFLPATGAGPFPVAVVLHYWGATGQRAEVALAQELVDRGIAAVLVSLPYHMERTPKGRTSGELAIQPDPESMRATMGQSVLDVRRTVDWIATRPELDANRIALTGTSLGGLVGATAYGVEPRITAAAFVLAGADLAHILWHSSRVVAQRDELRRRGYSEGRLREELAGIEPLRYLARRRTSPTFVVGARFDTVIPPEDTQKLIEALPEAHVLWVDTGHYGGVFVQRKILHLVADFVEATFVGRAFEPPGRLYAPTLRIGVQWNTTQGLQVAVGLDLWKSSARAEAFASFLVTPKGAQVFLGHQVGRGFAIGVAARPDGIAVGAFWSTIL